MTASEHKNKYDNEYAENLRRYYQNREEYEKLLDPEEQYIPTPEELKGNSWNYCYGNEASVVLPPPQEPDTK